MQLWLNSGESVDDIFTLLKFEKAADDVLASTMSTTWANYINFSNKENPDKKNTLYAILVHVVKHGDEGLSKIADTALMVKSSSTFAQVVQAEFNCWMASGKSVDDVFMLMILDKVGDTVLTSPPMCQVPWRSTCMLSSRSYQKL